MLVYEKLLDMSEDWLNMPFSLIFCIKIKTI